MRSAQGLVLVQTVIDRNPDQLVEIPVQAIRRTRVRFLDKLRAYL